MIIKKVYYGKDTQALTLGEPAFFWPESEQKRQELYSVRRNHPDVYESIYQCRPGQRIGSIFLEDDFIYYLAPTGLSLGLIDPEVRKFLDRFQYIVAAWDTAFEATDQSSFTVGIVAGLLSCEKFHREEDAQVLGECEQHFDVYILDVVRGKFPWGDLPREFRRLHRRWGVHVHVVEKKGVGISLYQSMPSIGIRVEGVDVRESKRARAIRGNEAGSTQGWFRQHRVYLPFAAEWIDKYKMELKDFTGDDSGDDDQVDATVHLINYAIRAGSQIFILPSTWTPETVDVRMEVTPEANFIPQTSQQSTTVDFLNWIIMAPSLNDQPFEETCGYCKNNQNNYCSIQQRPVAVFDSCMEYTARDEVLNG
jgi:predicted phage terminase large subunit-like protein